MSQSGVQPNVVDIALDLELSGGETPAFSIQVYYIYTVDSTIPKIKNSVMRTKVCSANEVSVFVLSLFLLCSCSVLALFLLCSVLDHGSLYTCCSEYLEHLMWQCGVGVEISESGCCCGCVVAGNASSRKELLAELTIIDKIM